ncbi:MAG: acyltransferase, partial [Muribaculaceae bacterium]|nr:acyltransferase [Muribaculaceae bacterium]
SEINGMRLTGPHIPYKITTPNNMGVVRYILAFAVLFAHFKTLAGYNFYFPVSSYEGVGGFFALSGFLIYGSYLRKPGLKSYLTSRAWRILPAYWVTVIFFALLLCIASTLTPGQYFTSSGFWEYLAANISFLNFLHPALPGVFDSPAFYMDAVNGSLWTMKIEWCLYITPPIVVWLIRRLKANPMVMFTLIYILACAYRITFEYMYEATGSQIYEIMSRQIFGQLSYFYAGVGCYYSFHAMMRRKWLVLIVAIVALSLQHFIPYGHIIIHPLALAVLVIWVSMVGRWGTWEGKHDNTSYNIYLIHFPIIQLFVHYRGDTPVSLPAALALCLLTTILLAYLLSKAEHQIRHHLRKQ